MRAETQYFKEFVILRVCFEGSGVGLGDDSLDIHVVDDVRWVWVSKEAVS